MIKISWHIMTVLIYIFSWSDFDYATVAFRKCGRTSLRCIASVKGLTSLHDANVLTRTEERWSFRFWHYLSHSQIRVRPLSIHIPGALNAKRYFRYRVYAGRLARRYRYDGRELYLFSIRPEWQRRSAPGCDLTLTHVYFRFISDYPLKSVWLRTHNYCT